MKDCVKRMQRNSLVAKFIALFLLCTYPLIVPAQVDDIYFVPSKEKENKVLVIKSTAERYNIGKESSAPVRDADEYNRRTVAYTNSPDEYVDENYADEYMYEDGSYDDYSYSTRIIRFRNPRRAVYSSIYWDLTYGCGINDWLIYDNGYSIDIYPTYNNPLYYWGDFAFAWNPFSWYSWHSWHGWHHTAYWGWHHPYYGHYYGHCYDHYYGHHNHFAMHHSHNYWSPVRRNSRYIPTNGAVGGGRYDRGGGNHGDKVASSGRGNGNNNSGRVNLRGNADNRGDKVASAGRGDTGNDNGGRVNLRGNANNRSDKSSVQSGNRGNGAGFKIGEGRKQENAIRRQQPSRGSVNAGSNRSEANSKGNGANVRKERNGSSSSSVSRSSSVNRRNSGSTSGYNRPSSTSTTRSRNSSSSDNRNSSYSRSSSSSRSNSSSYSSGSSSRGSSSFGGGSRGGSSGGSRSGGSRSGGGRGR